jgi:hypothetical protein
MNWLRSPGEVYPPPMPLFSQPIWD